ncbi:MAG: YncE family protein [Acidimicrobiales bacterium]
MRKSVVSRTIAVVALTMAMFFSAAPTQATPLAEVINLPNGFFPEGVTIGKGVTFYTGSLIDGAIYTGNLRTGEGEILVEGQPGLLAVGMDYRSGSRQLFVAGGSSGTVRVYDTDDGSLVTEVPLGAGFINDVIVTRRSAFVTNSFAPEIYEIPLGTDGRVNGPARVIPLGGDFEAVEGFNTNGIEVVDPRTVIIVNSSTGILYLVDTRTGDAKTIDTGGAVINGDGLLLRGRSLYAVVGSLNQVTELRLSRNNLRARVTEEITNELFDVPTTVDGLGEKLYVVSAKFNTPPTPETPYEIVAVDR